MTIKNITKNTNCNEEQKLLIKKLITLLMDDNPKARPNINEILETLRSIGEDVENQAMDPFPYI